MSSDIVIEITGLKSLSKFIGLEDTPLYYDNGKFFKVEDNKIIYTDIEWKDISGDINEAPEIINLIKELVETISGETIHGYIEEHNSSESAHQYIQNTIQEEIFTRIEADNTLQDNIDITNNNLEKEIEDRIDGDTLLQNNINNLSNTVTNNYNTLDNKIDTEISNRTSADEELQDDIDNLSNTVTNNYTELNNKILNNTNNITANTNSITNINSKIPQQASASNKLADKNFVNSSIATNTANFIGTFNSVAELEAYSGVLTNNDYAFVATTDSVGNTLYDRYKWNGSEWLFEYELNNSSFTASQWASINSGITDTLTTQITTNQNAITNIQNNYVPNTRTVNGKALSSNITLNASDVNALANTTTINDLTTTAQQNALNSGATSAKINQIATNTENITNNANAISTINETIPSDASSSNKLVTISDLSNMDACLANKDLSNLTNLGDGVNRAVKGYNEDGNIIYDKQLVADISGYKHSTFDSSKFMETGSVIISDGLASGFVSQTNYLTGIFNAVSPKKSIEMWCKFIANNDDINGAVLCALDGNLRFQRTSATGVGIRGFSGGLVCDVPNLTINTGDEVILHGTITLTDATLEIWINGVKNSTVGHTLRNNTFLSSYHNIKIGGQYTNGDYSPASSIDLKYQRVLVDNIEVFNGCKTGMTTYKPDNFTVKTVLFAYVQSTHTIYADRATTPTKLFNVDGSNYTGTDFTISEGVIYYNGTACTYTSGSNVTIRGLSDASVIVSEDGVAEYFNAGNKIETGTFTLGAEDWEIIIPYKVPSNALSFASGTCLMSTSGVYNNITLGFYNSSGIVRLYLVMTSSESTQIFNNFAELYTGNSYLFKISHKGTQYSFEYSSDNGVAWKHANGSPFTSSALVRNYNVEQFLTLGARTGNNNYPLTDGQIDLNTVQVFRNGKLIYQPCLKIPFVESKNGAPIIDSKCATRALALYRAGGNSPYYVLQEDVTTDFEIIGNPTIAGTTASGFGASDYIKKAFTGLTGNSIKIRSRFYYENSSMNGRIIKGSTGDPIRIYADSTNQRLVYAFNGSSYIPYSVMTEGNWYIAELEVSPSRNIAKLLDANGNILSKKEKVGTQTINVQNLLSTFYIGYNISTDFFSGQIDLSGCEIFVDGNFLWSPIVQPNVMLPMGDIYSKLERLEELKDNLERVNSTKALSTGKVVNYPEEYKEIQERAHSTFDLSKFTVVGSPNITADGVASGFSTSNYFEMVDYHTGLTLGTDFELYIPFTLSDKTTATKLMRLMTDGTFRGLIDYNPPYGMLINMSDGTNSVSTGGNKFAITPDEITVNELYIIVLKQKNQTFTYGYIHNGIFTQKGTIENFALDMPSINHFYVGRGADAGFSGSIDLKYFGYKINGIPVFSGCKTGIDTIKPLQAFDQTYGDTTITNDGIAMNVNSQKGYLRKVIGEISSPSVVKVCSRFRILGQTTSSGGIFTCRGMRVDRTNTGSIYARGTSNSTDTLVGNFVNAGDYNFGDVLDFEAIIYPSSVYVKIYDVTKNATLYDNTLNVALDYPSSMICLFLAELATGNVDTAYVAQNTEVDLNALKVYVDGSLVYQPCLKIPYTQSKTGSKIVDAVYRDRVNDMASQFGYANYYTLDEDNGNFTLPQGEVYGLIGDKTLRDSYYNGVTYWELFSNRRLEQGGICESGIEYTLPKPFADANYVLTIPYSSKTATSFIPSATGDFIAKGMGLL